MVKFSATALLVLSAASSANAFVAPAQHSTSALNFANQKSGVTSETSLFLFRRLRNKFSSSQTLEEKSSAVEVPSLAQTHMQGPLTITGSGKALTKDTP